MKRLTREELRRDVILLGIREASKDLADAFALDTKRLTVIAEAQARVAQPSQPPEEREAILRHVSLLGKVIDSSRAIESEARLLVAWIDEQLAAGKDP